MPTVSAQGKSMQCEVGANLRQVLRANGIERLVLELQPAGAAQPEEALA